MQSRVTIAFLRRYRKLPADMQKQAWQAYLCWRKDHYHQELQFKCVSQNYRLYSARIFNTGFRVAGFHYPDGDMIAWDFIGSHDEYKRYYKQWQ